MATFHILNFGCRASQADGAALKTQLVQAGFVEAADPQASHIAILNTCTVTAAADAEVRQTIRRIHRLNPGCKILVTGCYAQRAPQEIAALEGVAWVVGNSHKHQVIDLLQNHLAENPEASSVADSPGGDFSRAVGERCGPDRVAVSRFPEVRVGEIAPQFHFIPAFPNDRTRPTLKVQDGCNARCSFCIIPTVRGRSRSLPPEQAVSHIRALEQAGYQEVVISGINLGSYGRDLDRRTTFLGLLEKILGETRIPRLRISSIEPMDVNRELIAFVARERRMADHFHVPLQSGCDRILRQMNRRYWAAQYADRILAIREMMPNCGIGADVMVGFPGETNDDHAVSARFIDSLPFTYLHVFPYSARPSTPAAMRKDQVNGRIAHERGAELHALAARKRREFLTAQVGRVLSAVTLDEAHSGGRRAISSNYLNITLPAGDPGAHQLVNISVRCVHEDHLFGHVSEGDGSTLATQA
jgi:threonylcarbamoyladenosine tRNA methylthiotransferase MtaB